MKETCIGVDFSMNSAAICTLRNDKYNFYAFPRGVQKRIKENLDSSGVILNIIPKEKLESKILADKERFNSNDADFAINKIIIILNDVLLNTDAIGIEGIAFMARGNSIAQFAGYHYILRYLLSKYVGYENIHVFAPNSIKMTAGKGNFKKFQMIDAFINSEDKDLHETQFHKKIKIEPELFQTKTGNWLSPIDDIVDSFWTLQTLLKTLS